MDKERLIIDPTVDIEPGATKLNQGDVVDMEISSEPADAEVKFGDY
jgi:hypothetical protein